jgi:hypothetical protein
VEADRFHADLTPTTTTRPMIDRRSTLSVALPIALATLMGAAACASTPGGTAVMQASSDPNYVEVVPRETDRRVDVVVGGKPFTSYVWPTTLKKPVLFPLRAASGVVVTRGYPLEPRAGERADHPHHAGMWFNYGDVNGLDFWNNSDAIPEARRSRYGSIVHRSVRSVKSGSGEGVLETTEEWVGPDNAALLREDTRYVFRASLGARTIERITTLTALDKEVKFTDNKEGVLAIRVARSLEHPSLQPEKFTDAQGNVTPVARLDTSGVHGHYLSSEGKQGDDVWGTRGKWTVLHGDVGGTPVSLAILDHPKNWGYPTYWHARGYGLFAANSLGQKSLTNGKAEATDYKLAPKASVTFRHQVVILDGTATPADITKYYTDFTR